MRTAGAPLQSENSIRLIIDAREDARENCTGRRDRLEGGRRTIHIEMCILHGDQTCSNYVDVLMRKAREGWIDRLYGAMRRSG